MEKNKTGKYLKYAIGEILLVVIGIIIALQINTWSEYNKDRQTEGVYLIGILNDLNEQKLVFEEQLTTENNWIDLATRGLSIIDNGAVRSELDTLNHIINVLSPRKTFSLFNPTYEELKSTGNLRLIKDEATKKDIIRFYQNLEHLNQIIKNNNFNIDNIYKPYIINNSLGFYQNKNNELRVEWRNQAVQIYQLRAELQARKNYASSNRDHASSSLRQLELLEKKLTLYLESE